MEKAVKITEHLVAVGKISRELRGVRLEPVFGRIERQTEMLKK